ncbi:alpha/beta fold hydrolase [Glaciibacter sp. 2TAF33]|uniref:alpha/beta fold hydrolase n=1 Tax=Glaciibacter sp. 2TAF33 TaxID=3233015 RepID=UPI003F90AB5F
MHDDGLYGSLSGGFSGGGLDSGRSIETRLGMLRVREMGAGPPAVLWHSLFVDSTTWSRVVTGLAGHRRLLIVDGPSHGDSECWVEPFTLDDCVGAAGDVLDRLGVREPVDWVGNAWGGHVGIAFAASQADRCRTLVTVGTPVHPLTPDERRQLELLLPVYRLAGPVRPIIKALAESLLGPGAEPDAVEAVAHAFRRAPRSGMRNAIRCAALERPDLTDTLAAVLAPTLMVTAARDPGWTPTEARAVAASLTGLGIITLPGTGRVSPLYSAAPALVALVANFWFDPLTYVSSR